MTKINTPYYYEFYQNQGTVVQGTWAWVADALQTDFASVTGEIAGVYRNSTNTNLDEYKRNNIFLTKGNYKITIIHRRGAGNGIVEVLYGTTSLDTINMGTAAANNVVWTITFTLQNDTTSDLRFRSNGTSGANYRANFSRFLLEKTG